MLSVLLLRIFFILAFAALVLWFAAKVWPKSAAKPEQMLPLSTMTEQELRNAKAILEEKRRQLTNLKALADVNRAIEKIDHELSKLTAPPSASADAPAAPAPTTDSPTSKA